MKKDIEIALENKMLNINEISKKLNIDEQYLEVYGKYKAKINYKLETILKPKKSKLILVTAISPTPAGEGKTTTTVGLGDALNALKKNPIICLREPSLGPVFGIKGGAAGGGYAQVVPMDEINLHFTGDLHAIGSANNLLAALIDNHIFHGNELKIDPKKITWKRCLDINDRQLRNITSGLGGYYNGTPREDSFDITVASEIMGVFCLANNFDDLKKRLEKIVIGYTYDDLEVSVKDLNCVGSLLVLLQNAFSPNLVQTLEKTPAIIHGGPFANIAHGCNSVIATKLSLKLGDIVVTEAGFGADLGAEKFFDIKCRQNDLNPDCVVIVATIRALKYHGGIKVDDLKNENIDSLINGYDNLKKHVTNLKEIYNMNVVVAINKFYSDTEKEIKELEILLKKDKIEYAISEVFELGSIGGINLAQKVLKNMDFKKLSYPYDLEDSIETKIYKVATKIYGANSVKISKLAQSKIKKYPNLPICIAKTQYSFSDDPKLLGAPKDFEFSVKDVILNAGSNFIVVISGNIMRMPGLPKHPAANDIDIINNEIVGLF